MTLATFWGQANICWIVDLEAKERVMEDMRIALTEQEETQSQMEEILEDKLQLIQELSDGKTNSWSHCFRRCWNYKWFSLSAKHSILKNWKENKVKYYVMVIPLRGTTLGQSANQGLIFHTFFFPSE